MNSLFEPYELAGRTLRFVMAPMTAARANVGEAERRPED